MDKVGRGLQSRPERAILEWTVGEECLAVSITLCFSDRIAIAMWPWDLFLPSRPHASAPPSSPLLVLPYCNQINDRYEFPEELDLDFKDRCIFASEADKNVRNQYRLHRCVNCVGARCMGEHVVSHVEGELLTFAGGEPRARVVDTVLLSSFGWASKIVMDCCGACRFAPSFPSLPFSPSLRPCSVLVHSGGVHGGHYYAFIRPDGQKWIRFDDDRVELVDSNRAVDDQFGEQGWAGMREVCAKIQVLLPASMHPTAWWQMSPHLPVSSPVLLCQAGRATSLSQPPAAPPCPYVVISMTPTPLYLHPLNQVVRTTPSPLSLATPPLPCSMPSAFSPTCVISFHPSPGGEDDSIAPVTGYPAPPLHAKHHLSSFSCVVPTILLPLTRWGGRLHRSRHRLPHPTPARRQVLQRLHAGVRARV